MDELSRLCARMLGTRAGAAAVPPPQAIPPSDAADDRIERIRAALAVCRDLTPAESPGGSGSGGVWTGASPAVASTAQAAAAPADAAGAETPDTADPSADAAAQTDPGPPAADNPELRTAVAGELTAAVAGLSERQRALLALRDLLELSHAQIGEVLDAGPDDVTLGLAHARIALREQLRGPGGKLARCPEHDRALRTMTLRLDHEPVPDRDEEWIIEHLGLCDSCARQHSAMLEAAACYRGWPEEDPPDRRADPPAAP